MTAPCGFNYQQLTATQVVRSREVPPDALKRYQGASVAHQPPSVLTLEPLVLSLRIMSLPFIPTSWTGMVGRIITTDHNVPSLGRMLHVCSSGMACIIKFNVFHFGLLVSFHIANLRLKISGNEVTAGENHENLHPVKFPMYTCMHVYLRLSSFLHMYLHKLTSATP